MKQKAFFALVVAGILAGLTGVIIKNIEMDSKAITWVRMIIPVIAMGIWIKWKKISFFRSNIKPLLIASLLNAFRLYLYIFAFVYTSIGNAAILFYTWPIFTTILGIYFLREKVKPLHFILILLAFSGLIIAYSDQSFNFNDNDFLGMLAAVIASLIYAITVVIFKSEIHAYTKNEMVFYQNLIGSILYLPFFVLALPTITAKDIALSSSYGVLVGIVVFYLFFYGLTYLKAYVASAVMYLEVVGAVILGYLFLGERLTIPMLLGGSLIVISSFILNQREK